MTAAPNALAGLRILVVDDNQDALESLGKLLEMNGAEVRYARTSAQARVELHAFRADVMISDLAMPGEDGFDLIMSIRRLSDEEGGRTPAIAFSANDDALTRARALQSGFQELVSKLDLTRLLSAAASLAGRGRG
jgi:CheY-like chemotaxis protein